MTSATRSAPAAAGHSTAAASTQAAHRTPRPVGRALPASIALLHVTRRREGACTARSAPLVPARFHTHADAPEAPLGASGRPSGRIALPVPGGEHPPSEPTKGLRPLDPRR